MELYSSDNSKAQAADIDDIRIAVKVAAQKREKDCVALLGILRQLEELHRDIRETLFQESLPTNRQHLYHLLRDIEVNGGWPYIQRIKLTQLLATLEAESTLETSED
ncbi:hypothetical protein Lepto7375DRAFT_6013 [Leptolyngbya sp. PCC 7375]|nr:hypothetical protein Lepto7375DRAFT_6013 [Leptolyngbya sp. PCC 7375]